MPSFISCHRHQPLVHLHGRDPHGPCRQSLMSYWLSATLQAYTSPTRCARYDWNSFRTHGVQVACLVSLALAVLDGGPMVATWPPIAYHLPNAPNGLRNNRAPLGPLPVCPSGSGQCKCVPWSLPSNAGSSLVKLVAEGEQQPN
jgi:hypothetical protein